MWSRERPWSALSRAILFGSVLTACKVTDANDYTFEAGGKVSVSAGRAGAGGSQSGTGGAVPEPQGTCADGEHWCVDACVRNDAVATCGASCSPCDVPIDGSATCDGRRCGASCEAGKKLCLGACIGAAEPCEGRCPAGTHACDDRCVSDQSVNACGTSCDPCPVPPGAAQATCDGEQCDFECLSGARRCGDACVQETDVNACGPACTRCPSSDNGAAKCVDGTCIIQCAPGFHLCGDRCVDDASPLTCGSSCEPCPQPTGGTATCEAGVCGRECPPGQEVCLGACVAVGPATTCDVQCDAGAHACGGLCVQNTSVHSCGTTSCSACAAPQNGRATCNGISCGIACNTGYHSCGGFCVANSSVASCGSSCTACPAPPTNATATCDGTRCGFVCTGGYTGTNCELPRLQRVPRIAGASASTISGLSADGTAVIGNLQRTAQSPTAYHWLIGAADVTPVGPLAGQSDSTVGAFSGDGRRVYGMSGTAPFRWLSTEELTQLPPRTGSNITFYDADRTGAIVVGSAPVDGLNTSAFIYDSAFGSLGVSGTFDSSALYGITADGLTAVGNLKTGTMTFAAVWTRAAGLTALSGAGGSASEISDDARFIVGITNNRATRWSGTGYATVTPLPMLAGTTASSARDVNADGTVSVGWGSGTASSGGALIWTTAGVRRVLDVLVSAGVDVTGWTLNSADFVSADGKVIAGSGTAPDGQTTGFIARMP